ncbi:MAG: hypothetical protein ACP5SH_26880 [Syntrophobacteraceae bacterium]
MSPKSGLKIVEKPKVEYESETVYVDYFKTPGRQPVYTEAELDAEWQRRQSEADRKRRPVEPPPKKSYRAVQIEMFESTHEHLFKSDMKFKSFQLKPGKDDDIVGVLTLEVDCEDARIFEPILKLQNQFVDVLVAGTKVTTKDLG